MSVTPKELREAADNYEPRTLYQSEWRHPIMLLRLAATALELAATVPKQDRSPEDV